MTTTFPGKTLRQIQAILPAARALTDETDLAAINSALLNGGHVTLLYTAGAAACVVNGPVLLTSDSVLTGHGMGVSVIRAVPAPARRVVDFAVVSLGRFQPRVPLSNMRVADLTVDDGSPPDGAHLWNRATTGNSAGVYVGPLSTNFHIEHVEARYSSGNGIVVAGQDGEVSGSHVHDNWANGIYVMGVYNGGHPIYTERVRIVRSRVFHNSLYNYPGGATLNGTGSAWTPQPATFDSGHPYSFDGIDIDGLFRNISVEGNNVTGNDIIALERGNYHGQSFRSSNVEIVGNVVDGSSENAFNVTGPIDDIQVLNNKSVRLAEAASIPHGNGPHGCLTVVGPVNHLQFRGNYCDGAASYGVLAYGGAGAPTDITVAGNIFHDMTIRGNPLGMFSVMTFKHGTSGLKVLNNTIIDDRGPGGSGAAYAVDTRQAASGAEVSGNTPFAGVSGTWNVKGTDLIDPKGRPRAGHALPP